MATANNSPGQSLAKTGIRYFALALLPALLVTVLASHYWGRQDLIPDENSIAERIQPMADVELVPQPNAAAERGKRAGALLVHESCRSCHSNGEGGAPKIGDRKAWAPRINQGLDALVQSVVSGKCSIPRGSSDADQRELARAVVYMIWPRMRP